MGKNSERGNENDSFTNIVAKTLKEEAGRSQSTGRPRENSLPNGTGSGQANEMRSSKNGNDSSLSPLSLAVLPTKSSTYSPDLANTPTADQRFRSRTGSFSSSSSKQQQQQLQQQNNGNEGNRPRGVSLDIPSGNLNNSNVSDFTNVRTSGQYPPAHGRSQSAARGSHQHQNYSNGGNDQPQPSNMKDIWVDPDIQHNLQIQGSSSTSAKHYHAQHSNNHNLSSSSGGNHFGSSNSDIENSMPGLLRKNSKQAWNEKGKLLC